MEFDKSKILTVVTVDQLKEGQLGWINDYVDYLESDVKSINPYKVFRTNKDSTDFPFTAGGRGIRRYFYPEQILPYEGRQDEWIKDNNVKRGTKVRVTRTFTEDEDGSCCLAHDDLVGETGVVSNITALNLGVDISGYFKAVPYFALEVINEPTYKERQAEWVKENNVKEGTTVRVTRTFTENEDGSRCWKHDDLVGMVGSVYGIASYNLEVDMDGGSIRVIPYFALEVIKEPTYRPYNNDELNDLVGEVLTNKQSGRRKLVTGKPTASEGVNLDGSYITAKDLLASFYRNRDEPCGVKE